MAKLNHHFSKLSESYFFPEIEKKIAAYQTVNPSCRLLNLGIGDITLKLNFPVRFFFKQS